MTTDESEQVGVVTRPRSVVWYERLAWTALVVGLASAAANPAEFAKYYDQYHGGNLILMVVVKAVELLWIWLIARRRQNWARWITLLWLLLGILGIADMIGDVGERFQLNPVATIIYYVAFAIWVVSVMLLFRGDAREWFSESASRLAPNSAAGASLTGRKMLPLFAAKKTFPKWCLTSLSSRWR